MRCNETGLFLPRSLCFNSFLGSFSTTRICLSLSTGPASPGTADRLSTAASPPIHTLNDDIVDDLATTNNGSMTIDLEMAEAKEQLVDDQSELQNAERVERDFEEWQADIESLEKLIAEQAAKRRQLNSHLHEFIDRIEVFSRGLPSEYDGEDFADYFHAIQA